MGMDLDVSVEKESSYFKTYTITVSVDGIFLAKDTFMAEDLDSDIDLTLPENQHHLAATVKNYSYLMRFIT